MTGVPTFHYDRKHRMIFLGSRVTVQGKPFVVEFSEGRYWLHDTSEDIRIPLNDFSAKDLCLQK